MVQIFQYPSKYNKKDTIDKIILSNDGWNTWKYINLDPSIQGIRWMHLDKNRIFICFPKKIHFI